MEPYSEDISEELSSGAEDVSDVARESSPRYMCDGYNVVVLAPSNDILILRISSGSFVLKLIVSLEYVTYKEVSQFYRSLESYTPAQLDLGDTTRVLYDGGDTVTVRISAMGETIGLRPALYHEVSLARCPSLIEAFGALERRKAWFG